MITQVKPVGAANQVEGQAAAALMRAGEHEFILLDVPDELTDSPDLFSTFREYLTIANSSSEAWEDTTGNSYD